MSNASYRNLSYWDGFSDQFRDADIHVQAGIFTADAATDSIGRDMAGGFAIPGLIDAHVHMCLNPKISDPLAQADADDDQILEEIRARALAMVRAGITTARDLGGGAWLELRIRDEIMRGDTPGPRLICAGQPITSVGGHCHFWGGQASNTEQALTVLARQCEHGSDLIKVMVTGGNITPGSTPKDSQFEDEVVVEIVR
ncbi:MAG: amidohydrolase family protein, partial [Gammaproteobacteria bacterium]|nr:amidohydrolase family protein [Gammaproteobacteria bacterium]